MIDTALIHPICIGCGVRHASSDPCPDGTQWIAALVECRVCTKQHAMVMPIPPGSPYPTNTECPNCGAMACDTVERQQ